MCPQFTQNDQLVALCNIVCQPRFDRVLLQSCMLFAETFDVNRVVLFLLDKSGRNLIVSAGCMVGNINWGPKEAIFPLEQHGKVPCPVSQTVLTGQRIFLENGGNGYDLSVISELIDTQFSTCGFLPLHNAEGHILGVYAIVGDGGFQQIMEQNHVNLLLRTLAVLIDQRSLDLDKTERQKNLLTTLQRADEDRKQLKDKIMQQMEKRLPGNAIPMQKLRERIGKLANFYGSILILGPDGCYKEKVAHELHLSSKRFRSPFLYVDCKTLNSETFILELFGHKRGAIQGVAAARKGLLREAGEGTLYFDRVDCLALEQQEQLLRLMDTKKYRPIGSEREVSTNARFIFSSLPNLINRKETGEFLPSLYYKIDQARLDVPLLNERIDDFTMLISRILEGCAKIHKRRFLVSPVAISWLEKQPWLGNDREFDALIARACMRARETGQIELSHLYDRSEGNIEGSKNGTLKETVEAFERSILIKSLDEWGNDRTKTAENLSIPKRTLADKCKKYGL